MQDEKQLMETATQFIRITEEQIEKMKKAYNIDFVVITLSEEDFYEVFKAMEIIRELGRVKKIYIEINDQESSYEEYANPWCFLCKKI